MNFSLRRELSVRYECKNYRGGWGLHPKRSLEILVRPIRPSTLWTSVLRQEGIKCTAAQGCALKIHQKCVSSAGEWGEDLDHFALKKIWGFAKGSRPLCCCWRECHIPFCKGLSQDPAQFMAGGVSPRGNPTHPGHKLDILGWQIWAI